MMSEYNDCLFFFIVNNIILKINKNQISLIYKRVHLTASFVAHFSYNALDSGSRILMIIGLFFSIKYKF